MKEGKIACSLICALGLSLLSACATVPTNEKAAAPMVPPKPLAMPLGKNWKVIEEAPNLSDERGHVPFQMEQSVQPPGAPPVTPSDNRILQTPPR